MKGNIVYIKRGGCSHSGSEAGSYLRLIDVCITQLTPKLNCQVKGNIVYIKRGGCSFTKKADFFRRTVSVCLDGPFMYQNCLDGPSLFRWTVHRWLLTINPDGR